MLSLRDAAELRAQVGTEVGVSDWYAVTQADIDGFADVTGDDQWIHVDPVRARSSELGGTVAHGLLTLSLGPKFTYQLLDSAGVAQSLNYGYDRVRFPAPLRSGSRVRMRLKLEEVSEVPGGLHVCLIQTFEVEGHDTPACVAHALARLRLE